MELLDKMKKFLKKQPSKAELERIDKRKADADRARMEDLRARIEAAGAFSPTGLMSDEDQEEIRQYFRQIAACAKSVQVTAFDVSAIDRHVAGLVTILERAMKEGGSKDTILRCFQGISYGILDGHAPISENAIESDIVSRRENTVDRYLRIAQYSFETDQLRHDADKKRDQKRKLQLEFEEAQQELNEMIREHPRVWYDLQDLTPLARDEVTGDMKVMAAQEKKAVDLKKNENQVDLMIGHALANINALETTTNTLFLQLKNWESEIDEMSVADVIRLGKEFERQMIQETEMISRLNDASETMDKMIQAALAGRDVKADLIKYDEEYKDLLAELEKQEALDREGGLRFEQEQEQKRLQAEQEAQQQMNSAQTTETRIYYN